MCVCVGGGGGSFKIQGAGGWGGDGGGDGGLLVKIIPEWFLHGNHSGAFTPSAVVR